MSFYLTECSLEAKSYQLSDYQPLGARFISRPCYYDFDNLIDGTLTITKLDRIKLIISGNFEFTMVTVDCDTTGKTQAQIYREACGVDPVIIHPNSEACKS